MTLKSRNKRLVDYQLASLTDIIFLLLIFFILTSNLVTPSSIPMMLPNSNSKAQATQNVAVDIDADLNYYLNGKAAGLEQIKNMLPTLLKDKEQSLILRADKSVPIENVVQILNVANELKIKVVLATEPIKE